jgi:hypothetical protein
MVFTKDLAANNPKGSLRDLRDLCAMISPLPVVLARKPTVFTKEHALLPRPLLVEGPGRKEGSSMIVQRSGGDGNIIPGYLPGGVGVRIEIGGDFSTAFLQAKIKVSEGFLDDLGS